MAPNTMVGAAWIEHATTAMSTLSALLRALESLAFSPVTSAPNCALFTVQARSAVKRTREHCVFTEREQRASMRGKSGDRARSNEKPRRGRWIAAAAGRGLSSMACTPPVERKGNAGGREEFENRKSPAPVRERGESK